MKLHFEHNIVLFFCITACKEGWYGEDCRQPCGGHCREKINCNHVTGQCDAGCDAGWTGVLCDNGNISNFITHSYSPFKDKVKYIHKLCFECLYTVCILII